MLRSATIVPFFFFVVVLSLLRVAGAEELAIVFEPMVINLSEPEEEIFYDFTEALVIDISEPELEPTIDVVNPEDTIVLDLDVDERWGLCQGPACITDVIAGLRSGDCDDADPTVRPGAYELCDGKDNDCDGEIDEECE